MEKVVIESPYGSPIIADPTFLPPNDSPDGKFHLLLIQFGEYITTKDLMPVTVGFGGRRGLV